MGYVHLAVILIALGIPVWILGSLWERHTRRTVPARKGGLGVALYFLTCLGWFVTYLYFLFSKAQHPATEAAADAKSWAAVRSIASDVSSLSNDPVFTFLIWAMLVFVGLALVPGIIGTMLYLMGFGLLLAVFLGVVVEPLIALARVSLGGAIVVGILGTVTIVWCAKTYRVPIGRAAWRVFEPAYAIFIDWWYPLLARRKERHLMEDDKKKRKDADRAVRKLERPGLPAVIVPSSVPSTAASSSESIETGKNIVRQFAERMRLRSQQKTNKEKIVLASQHKQFYSETRGAIDEYRGALEARDALERVEGGDYAQEKDEEAEIRGLERQKQKLTLERDIAGLDPTRNHCCPKQS